MAKYTQLSEENKAKFDTALDSTSIPQYVVFETLGCDSQKDLYRISKANDILETLTDGVNFVVILNESIFEELTDEQQFIVLTECLAGVEYNMEKDTLSLNKHNFTTHSTVLEHYGHEKVIALKESIKSLYDAKKQQEDEEKANKKNNQQAK